MNLDKFTGSGSTPSRRAFWDKVAEAVLSSRKREGRNVSVDEHQDQGTVVNFPDQTPSIPVSPCSVTFLGFQTGCRGTGSGASYAAAWADAFSNWSMCEFSSVGGGLAFGFKSGISFQAEADDQPMRFELIDSPTCQCEVSGTIRTRDDINGLVDETPFSFTLVGIGDTHDLTFTPIEPADPVGGVPNSTHSTAEDFAYNCDLLNVCPP